MEPCVWPHSPLPHHFGSGPVFPPCCSGSGPASPRPSLLVQDLPCSPPPMSGPALPCCSGPGPALPPTASSPMPRGPALLYSSSPTTALCLALFYPHPHHSGSCLISPLPCCFGCAPPPPAALGPASLYTPPCCSRSCLISTPWDCFVATDSDGLTSLPTVESV